MHPQDYKNDRHFLARKLIQHKMIKTKLDSPDGNGFRLKLHDKNPKAPLSPYYVDLRILRSFPPLYQYVAELILHKVCFEDGIGFNLVADVPTAGTPIVTLMSISRQTPMISPRAPKDHGTQATIDGVYEPGETGLLVDDLVTGANSLLASTKILHDAGLIVTDTAVLVDREQGGREQLTANGLRLHAVWTITDLLAFYKAENLIAPELVDEINAYRASVAVA
ncbi:MAG: hypothetical protein Q7S57_00010 [bacterium]|nr:hypothetical protein [bacterium]